MMRRLLVLSSVVFVLLCLTGGVGEASEGNARMGRGEAGFGVPAVLDGIDGGTLAELQRGQAARGLISNEGEAGLVLPDARYKIDGGVLEELQNGKTPRALIVMSEQADLAGADALTTKKEKGEFVFKALREVADRTQARVREQLDRRGVPYRAFYIANVIAVERLDVATANALAAEANVGRIVRDPEIKFSAPSMGTSATQVKRGIEWNILKIGADKVWQAGIRGKGIVVATQDTGVDWTHPALKQKYRGYDGKTQTVDHNYNWWDAIHTTGGGNPCGYNTIAPCDDYGHGTHTMGTLVGRSGNNRIGVAPKAKWISCRNMDQGVGRPTTYMECFEFFLAPWDSNRNNPDPNRAPDIVSNSWGCPASEGCDPDSLQQATRALRKAGIFVTLSAGNDGSGCGSVNEPSGIYNAPTTVGATDSNDELASFSSRGPVRIDGSNRRKPDISAPGVNVRSSIPGGGYEFSSGTSMASPHVAGAVALLWSAEPKLRGNIYAMEQLLFASANRKVSVPGNQTCGRTNQKDIPNNLFGYGRLDVWKAYESLR